ncbi:C4-dicarboxylate TRAP transporter substrate-binding protein [Pseudarthrobacter siccitolerans]|nr:C4-dicarboxylate TRAP transporter substrate-binding protein [Pseudarthrobacter siccitolerans]
MKSRKPKVSLGLLGPMGLALTLTLTACSGASEGGPDATADFEEVTLSLHVAAPPQHPQGIAFQAFVDEVAEVTNGKVTIEPFFSGSLLTGAEDLKGIGSGVADLGQVFTTYNPEALPVLNWFSELQSLRSDAIPHGMLQASAALQKKWTQSEEIQQEVEGHNIVLLGGSIGATNYGLLCTEPIESPEDANGRLVRVGGAVWAEEAKSLGLSPVSLTTSELYESLQRGVVNCTMSDPLTVSTLNLWEVAKFYHPISGSGTSSTLFAMNKDTWESLSADLQKVIQTATNNYQAEVNEVSLESYKDFAEKVPERGMTIVDPRPLNTVLHAYQQQHIKKVVDLAPPSIANPEEFLESFRSDLEWGMGLAIENVGTEPDDSRTPESILEGYLSGPDAVDLPKFAEAVRAKP